MAKTEFRNPEPLQHAIDDVQWKAFVNSPSGQRFLRDMDEFYEKWNFLFEEGPAPDYLAITKQVAEGG